jgi:spore coat polysaccharide biosynthesis protein SpsF
MNVTASIQARMGSSRLPGKVLSDVCGKPMLLWQVERILRSRLVDRVVVGTSVSSLDDQIDDFCKKNGVECFRGSEDDVLKRISSLVKEFEVDLHVECYGDSPLIDPQIIDEFIGYYFKFKEKADYFSSALETTYPPGLEVTLYPADILIQVDNMVMLDDPMREHVGYNITRFPDKFRLVSLKAPPWFSYPDTFLEVDSPEDLEVLRKVVGHFVANDQKHFSLTEILTLLRKNQSLFEGNTHVERRWKALRENKQI